MIHLFINLRKDSSVTDFYSNLYQGFVFRFIGSTRIPKSGLMIGKSRKSFVELRFILASFSYGRLWVIGNNSFWYTTKKMQYPLTHQNQICFALGVNSHHKSELTTIKYGSKTSNSSATSPVFSSTKWSFSPVKSTNILSPATCVFFKKGFPICK